ncbi:hypothetical protein NC652_009443 [Populus alba x Populus x berolinensis]|nr:hypothetical protein NC652_009443 [Populus alba x Populus x berolinensis]
MTVKWSFRTGVFSLGMMAVRFCPLHFEAVILLDVRGGHCFPRFESPEKREESEKQRRKDHIADIGGVLRDMGNPTLHSSSFDRGTSSNPHPEIKILEIQSPELEHTQEIKAARRC